MDKDVLLSQGNSMKAMSWLSKLSLDDDWLTSVVRVRDVRFRKHGEAGVAERKPPSVQRQQNIDNDRLEWTPTHHFQVDA